MSGSELVIVLLAALLLFGGKRLPELARTWGNTVREIRRVFIRIKRDMGLDFDFNEPLNRPPNIPPYPRGDDAVRQSDSDSNREDVKKNINNKVNDDHLKGNINKGDNETTP